jgi:uracil-DNA glycosylase
MHYVPNTANYDYYHNTYNKFHFVYNKEIEFRYILLYAMVAITNVEVFDKIVLNGVHEVWMREFTNGSLANAYRNLRDTFIVGQFDIGTLAPPLKDMLAAFRQDPNKIRLCILGQDPYTNGGAIGISFACIARLKVGEWSSNPSFKAIKDVTGCSDQKLSSWIAQGVWMLNVRLLATLGGQPLEEKYAFTATFVEECIIYLCKSVVARSAKCGFFLWGSFAHKYEELICTVSNMYLRTFKWHHPSPQANAIPEMLQFKNCTNFVELNSWFNEYSLPMINFATKTMDYNFPDLLVFTDGSCSNNGKQNVTSSCAFTVLELISAELPRQFPHTGNESIMHADSLYSVKYKYSEPGTPSTIPGEQTLSSPRSELEAIYQALKYLYNIGVSEGWLQFFETGVGVSSRYTKNIIIVSDCEYAINYATGMNQVAKNTDFQAGIIMMMRYLRPRIEHINSHKRMASSPMPFWTVWNNRIDMQAKSKNIGMS